MSSSRPGSAVRQLVARRANGCCEYCLSQVDFTPDPFSIEHILPQSRGGSDDPGNLALACQGCNNRKFTSIQALDPISGEATPLFHPRLHVWREHFAWSDDFSQLVGISAIGRATITRLDLNRQGVVNLRRALARTGDHPPR